MSDDSVVIKLIPEYSGEGDVSEWIEKLVLVCELRKVTELTTLVPLRLTGSAFAVYQQLPREKKGKFEEVKKSLLAAFAVNSFTAYEQFASRKLKAGESPDVYLANLRTLADQFGGVSDKTLTCAFVVGLPEGVRQALRAGADMEGLKLEAILRRARALLVDEGVGMACGALPARSEGEEEERPEEVCAGVVRPGIRSGDEVRGSQRSCFKCGGPNHFARHCWMNKKEKRSVKCYRCDEVGHVASKCPVGKGEPTAGNELRERV